MGEASVIGGGTSGRRSIVMLVVGWALACVTDPCRALCVDLAVSVDGCLAEWDVTWSDLGADSRRTWRVACQGAWATTRADMEVRQIPAAEEACSNAAVSLDDATCEDVASMVPHDVVTAPSDSGYP